MFGLTEALPDEVQKRHGAMTKNGSLSFALDMTADRVA